MDNLINFDEENPKGNPVTKPIRPVSPMSNVLAPHRSSIDLSNPFEKLDYFVQFADPFDCLEFADVKQKNSPPSGLQDGSLFSFDCFSNVSSIDSSHVTPSTTILSSSQSSKGSGKTVVSRSQSDSSTISSKSDLQFEALANRSADSVPTTKHQQLLKLSFYNSPNSPMKSSAFSHTALAGNLSAEARQIARKFGDCGDMSFEDLNNVSQNLVDSTENISQNVTVDADLQDMKINIETLGETTQSKTPTAEKIAKFQEQLERIKKEVVTDDEVFEIKKEIITPENSIVHDGSGDTVKSEFKKDNELEGILEKLKSVYTNGNRDEAKKQLNRLNELLGNNQQEPKNTLHVQPIVRQDTFEIDQKTGKRKFQQQQQQKTEVENDPMMEHLAKILGAHSLDVHSMGLDNGNGTGTKIVVVVPAPTSTPVKGLSRRLSFAKPQSTIKKHETPLKKTPAPRTSSFTTPRPGAGAKSTNPYDQKIGVQSRAGAVRKSLMGSMEKTPQVQKAPAARNLVRRSVSLKSTIPSVQVTKSSPTKATRPITTATPRRLSTVPTTMTRPSTTTKVRPEPKKAAPQFKAPAAVRKITVDKGSLV